MKVFSAICIGFPIVAAKVSYDGYKAFRIDTRSQKDVMEKLAIIDFVSLNCQNNPQALEVATGPDHLDTFEAMNMKHTVISEDLGAEFTSEGEFEPYEPTIKSRSMVAPLPSDEYFQSYHTFEQHLQFIEDLHAAFPGNSEMFDAGRLAEDRPICGIHLWGSKGPSKHPAIIWRGTVHAREWVVAPTVEYMTRQIIADYKSNDPIIYKTLEHHDIYVLPIVNPDGFVYTTTWDRLWRKNRQQRLGEWCVGTDINRNWPYQWEKPGSSKKPCEEDYRGKAPGDAPENRALVDHALSIANSTGIKSYIDWHSFGQLILLPYGHSCVVKAKNLDAQMNLASSVARAIQSVHGLEFKPGPLCSSLYRTAGGSTDWMADVAHVDFPWAIELRPRILQLVSFGTPPKDLISQG